VARLSERAAAAWGADPSRVALWGRSSGGHLATRVAWDTAALPVTVRGVVAFYAPFDLVAGYANPPRPDPLDVRAILRDFTGGTPTDRPDVYRDASPSTFVRPGLPPTLLAYGRRDHIVLARFGRDAAAALRRAGVPVVHLELPAAEHSFDEVPGGPDGQAALWVAEAFLARVLG
jgi:acetyl esterase/lipase